MGAPEETRNYRIGEVAERLGVTTRTIRYYEELGLLVPLGDRREGGHRIYDGGSIARLQQVLKLRDLLGLSLDEILALAEEEGALRDTWENDPSDRDRRRVLAQAQPLIMRQLELVRARQITLSRFARELRKTLRTIEQRRAALEAAPVPPSGLTSAGRSSAAR
jgi:DNA-binding transcriptional MerR regulator